MKKFSTSNFLLYTSTFFSGAIATFAIPPFSILPLFFVFGFGLYLISLISSLKKIFLASWFLGFGWFSFGLYWIGSAFFVADTYHIFFMPIAIVLLPSILALFWSFACVFAKILTKKNYSPILLTIVFLSLFEYLRANIFTGFPWLMPSMALSSNQYLIQSFSFIGSFSSNLVITTFSILPFILFSNLKTKHTLFYCLFIPIFILFFSCFLRFNNKNFEKVNNHLITLVQPNIEQKDKWKLEKRDDHLKTLSKLSIEAGDGFKDINRLIIWPETSFEGSIPKEINLLSSISKEVLKNQNTMLIAGLLRTDKDKIFNSLVFLNFQGKIIHRYDKTHLVPYGEYIPFRKNFSSIANFLSLQDFSSGKLNSKIDLKGFGNIVTLICYEVLFSDEVASRVTQDTKLLINITNDAWFGKTIGPYQHLALSKIRAVELGLPLARVANTGISVFISPYGDEIVRIPLFEEGAKTVDLVSPIEGTIYKNFGEYIFIILILFLMFINKLTIIKIRQH